MERPFTVVPGPGNRAYRAHRAPDLPVPVDEPVAEPHPTHPDHPHVPEEDDEPVPDHKPELH